MSILEFAREDFRDIIEDQEGFSNNITLSAPDGSISIDVQALTTSHRLSVDPETGMLVNAKNIHFSVSERTLNELGYPVRDANNEVSMRGHKVAFPDAVGVDGMYVIDQSWPNATLGVLVFILGGSDV